MSAPASPPDRDLESADTGATESGGWGWTRKQRVGLGCLVFLLLMFLGVQYWRRPFLLTDPAVVIHGETISLPKRIDPNTATAAELTRVPHLGEKLAEKMIAYREARKPLTPDGIVFHAAEDLGHIAGLGGKTLEQLRPFFQFPDDAETAATEPAVSP